MKASLFFTNMPDINVGAQKFLEKCGFILEGTERKAVCFLAAVYDRLNYAILKEEYDNARQ